MGIWGIQTLYSLLILSIVSAKKVLWFVGDKYLKTVVQVTVDNPDHFHQLNNFDYVESHFSDVMYFEHVPMAILDLFNTLKYVPLFIVIHVRASDFSMYNNHTQRQNIATMMKKVNQLIKAVDTHHIDGFKGVFYSLMLSVPWYLGWQQQQAAWRACARLNGALAKNAKLAGAYIMGHNSIHAQKSKGLYDASDPINLSPIGNHLFMANMLIKLEKILLPFHTAYQASRILKAMSMPNTSITANLTTAVGNLSLQ